MTCHIQFRPLSGTYISQSEPENVVDEEKDSVPCRGLIFLNYIDDNLKATYITIPSPVGDLYFSIRKDLLPVEDFGRFRPLSGTYISQYEVGYYKNTLDNSVPCRGLIFLNTISATSCKYWLYYTLCVGNDFVEI